MTVNDTLHSTPANDADISINGQSLTDAIIERELQQQQRLRQQMRLFSQRAELRRRRRQTAVVATLVNISSVAALLILAFVWQFYFPIAEAVAAILP